MDNFIKNKFENIFTNKYYSSFWFINTVGWVLTIAADTFIVSPELLKDWNLLINNTLQWSTGFIVTIGLRVVYKNFQYRSKSLVKIIGFVLFFSFISSLLLFASAHLIFILLSTAQERNEMLTILSVGYLAKRFTQIYPLMTTWSLLYFGIKFWMEWIHERDRAEKADLLAQGAQLQMLRYQVNPHFLFNSFSSLRALIRTDQNRAEEMVSKLSEFYRYSLATKSNSEVPLIEEIDAIVQYFEIEKIRFENKIEFEVNIDPLAEEYPIPCFLLHPIVENAIKYGMKTSEMPLKIKIDADVIKENLYIIISNTGRLYKHDKVSPIYSTKTGLSNIKNRLEYAFPNNHKFTVKEEDGMVKVSIEIYRGLK